MLRQLCDGVRSARQRLNAKTSRRSDSTGIFGRTRAMAYRGRKMLLTEASVTDGASGSAAPAALVIFIAAEDAPTVDLVRALLTDDSAWPTVERPSILTINATLEPLTARQAQWYSDILARRTPSSQSKMTQP